MMLQKNETYDDKGRVVRKSSKAYRKARREASRTTVVRVRMGQAVSRQHGKRRHKSKNTVTLGGDMSYSSDHKLAYRWRRERQKRRAA